MDEGKIQKKGGSAITQIAEYVTIVCGVENVKVQKNVLNDVS